MRFRILVACAYLLLAPISYAGATDWSDPKEVFGSDWDCGRMSYDNVTFNMCKKCYASAGRFMWKVPPGETLLKPKGDQYVGRCDKALLEEPSAVPPKKPKPTDSQTLPPPQTNSESGNGSGQNDTSNLERKLEEILRESPENHQLSLCNRSSDKTLSLAIRHKYDSRGPLMLLDGSLCGTIAVSFSTILALRVSQ